MGVRAAIWSLTGVLLAMAAMTAAPRSGASPRIAADTFAIRARARGPDCSFVGAPAVWRTGRDGTQVCPRTHSLIADRSLTGLRWSSWGVSVARATGYLSCEGSGCQGTRSERVSVELSRVRLCPDQEGDRIAIYSRYDLRLHSGPLSQRHVGYSIACSGMTGGAGNG
jgi:hypothetical protein